MKHIVGDELELRLSGLQTPSAAAVLPRGGDPRIGVGTEPGPLREQQVLFTLEPSLQLPRLEFFKQVFVL